MTETERKGESWSGMSSLILTGWHFIMEISYLMKQKKPKHCIGCPSWHKAGHKKESRLGETKYNNWCCHFSTHAIKAVSICKVTKYRENK